MDLKIEIDCLKRFLSSESNLVFGQSLEERINNSKNITFPWRGEGKGLRKLDDQDLTAVKKVVLILKGKDPYGYDNVEYIVELLDAPTQYNLKGDKIKKMRWWSHTISNDRTFYREYADEKTLKRMNFKIFEKGFRIKEVQRF